MKKLPTSRTLLAALLIFATAAGAYAADGGAILLTAVSGSVELMEGPEKPWSPAAAGAEIREGYMIRTGPDGRAQITFPDKAIVWVKESSSFGMQSTLPLTRKIKTESGEVKVSVPHLKRKQTFEVHTANAVAAVRGTVFTVKTDAAGQLHINVAYGEVKAHLVAEAKTFSVPQGNSFKKEEGASAKVSLMTKSDEKEIMMDWSPGLSEDLRTAVLDQKAADRDNIRQFADTTAMQQDAINNLVQQSKDEDFAAGRTLLDVHGNLTRVDQRLLRPSASELQFINLVKRPNYQYKDHGPAKPWINTQGAVVDRLDSMQGFITFDKELPQDLVEWPSFFSDNDITMVKADMVMTNQTDDGNPATDDILVVGTFGFNCDKFPGSAPCQREFGEPDGIRQGDDEIAGDFYVGTVATIADIRDTSKLLRAIDVDGVRNYSVDGEESGVLFGHGAAPINLTDGGGANAWLVTESYVIDNDGKVKHVDDFVKSGKDPFSLLRETAGQIIITLKSTTGGVQTNSTGSNPNIGGDFTFSQGGRTVDTTGKNIDLVIVPDLFVTMVQKLASSLSESSDGDESDN